MTDRLLLGLVRDELAAFATPEPEWNFPAEVSATGLLIAVALGLGKSGGDRQKQLGQAVARNVAPKIQKMKADSAGSHHLPTVVDAESIAYRGARQASQGRCGEEGRAQARPRQATRMIRIWLEPAVVNKLRHTCGPGESYSDVILRLAEQNAD